MVSWDNLSVSFSFQFCKVLLISLFAENARPICLPLGQLAKAPLEGQYAVVAGWGVTEKGKGG